MAPYAPHLAEEIGQRIGHEEPLIRAPFPTADPQWLVEETVGIPVQVNGKIRDRLQVAPDISEDAIRPLALQSDNVARHIEGKQVAKFIYVPKKIVTIVAR